MFPPQRPPGRGDETVDVRELMWCDPTVDEIEARIVVGQRLGVSLLEAQTVDAARGRVPWRWSAPSRDVAGHFMRNTGREGERRVANVCGDVEHPIVRPGRNQLLYARQARALGVRRADRIVASVPPELGPERDLFVTAGF